MYFSRISDFQIFCTYCFAYSVSTPDEEMSIDPTHEKYVMDKKVRRYGSFNEIAKK